jgi:hypothetical protein
LTAIKPASLPPCCPAAEGTTALLPAELLQLASTNLSIASNSFTGALPPSWTSPTLRQLDIRSNLLTGALPPAWGDVAALPALGELRLEDNLFTGVPHGAACCGASPAMLLLA